MIKSPCTSSGQQLGAGIMSSLDTPQHVTSLDQEIIKLDAALQACCKAAALWGKAQAVCCSDGLQKQNDCSIAWAVFTLCHIVIYLP
jgi:hypothetical protein